MELDSLATTVVTGFGEPTIGACVGESTADAANKLFGKDGGWCLSFDELTLTPTKII